MPKEVRLVLALTSGLPADNNLGQLGMQRLLRELAGLDMRAQRTELAGAALAPIVHHDLGHDVGEVELDRAHGAVGHDERARLDPLGLEQRRRLLKTRGLDDDVGAADAALPILGGGDRLAEVSRELGEWLIAGRDEFYELSERFGSRLFYFLKAGCT